MRLPITSRVGPGVVLICANTFLPDHTPPFTWSARWTMAWSLAFQLPPLRAPPRPKAHAACGFTCAVRMPHFFRSANHFFASAQTTSSGFFTFLPQPSSTTLTQVGWWGVPILDREW
jgi:hypothetical protein